MDVTNVIWVVLAIVWGGCLVSVVRLGTGVNAPQRELVVSVMCFASQTPLSSRPARELLDTIAVGANAFLVNVTVQGAVYALAAFFVLSAAAAGSSQRLLRGLMAVLGVALAAEAVLWGVMSVEIRADPSDPANRDATLAVLYTLVNLASMSFALAFSLPWARRLRGASRRGAVRYALTGIVVAITALLTACALKSLIVVVDNLGIVDTHITRTARVVPVLLVVFGVVTFALATSLAGMNRALNEFRLWRSHQKGIEELAPLWRLLITVFPEVLLDAEQPPNRIRRVSSLWGVQRRYYRRLVEIRDGLMLLQPYYDAALLDDDQEVDHVDPELTEHMYARMVIMAIRSKSLGQHPERVHKIPHGDGVDLHSDAQWLRRISAIIDAPDPSIPPTTDIRVPGR